MERTALFQNHRELQAKLVDFSGWEMPLHYGSQINEHRAVRQNVGVFDVSHMGVVDIDGVDSLKFLRFLLANDVAKLKAGYALYSCMLNEQGGVQDDLIVYCVGANAFRIVWNAGNRAKNLAWAQKVAAGYAVTLTPRVDLSIVAVQGPNALEIVHRYFLLKDVEGLKPFQFLTAPPDIMIACTGYTGESGLELMMPSAVVLDFWRFLMDEKVQPCGLGARDTLRLEAGFDLYGHEMDETVNPETANLSWTIDWKDSARDFIGKKSLENKRVLGLTEKLVGLVLQDKGVMRQGQRVRVAGFGEGVITSGTFSPTLELSIALARVPVGTQDTAEIERRGEWLPVRVVKPAFVRLGKSLI